MGTNSGAMFSKSKKELLLHFARKNDDIVTFIEHGSTIELKRPSAPQVLNPAHDVTATKSTKPMYIDMPSSEYSDFDRMILKEDVSHYVKSKNKLVTDLKWAYTILKGQCTDELIVKLETYDTYVQVNEDRDVIELLILI